MNNEILKIKIIRMKKMILIRLVIALFVLSQTLVGCCDDDNGDSQNGNSQQPELSEWWNESRFGMFIHWGVYSVFGNMYDGLNVEGEQVHIDYRNTGFPSEWIMNSAKIPRSVYRQAAGQFDASDYDPSLWVQIAKNAGMKYIVITAKHHDGFCLFDTEFTDWNAQDASGAGRDLLEELVLETKKAGLKMGFYYSQYLDWMAEGGIGEIPELGGEKYSDEQVLNYINNLVIPNIKELTTKYDIDLFWFDIPQLKPNDDIAAKIMDALLNSPVGDKIVFNDRLGYGGGYLTPESDTPDIPYNGYNDGRQWEACASLNNSWGYEKPLDSSSPWKSGLYIVSRLLELSSKGGNFLLNVGPDQHGVIPEEAVETLKDVGEWMKTHGDAVYGTDKNTLVNPFEYGYVTRKVKADGEHWYLHIGHQYLTCPEIVLPGVVTLPAEVQTFEKKQKLTVNQRDNNLVINIAGAYPVEPISSSNYYFTIDLRFSSTPEQKPAANMRNGQIELTPFQATTTTASPGKKDSPYCLTWWWYSYSTVTYNVFLDAGEYDIWAEYASWWDGGELYFDINGIKYTGQYLATGDQNLSNFFIDDLGGVHITIPFSDIYTLKITRKVEESTTNWISVRKFTLKKT
jgi:alpha-L-fucosidase